MRNALLPFAFAALTSACSVHSYVEGTASYTATPPAAGTSGASPLQAVMCVPNDDRRGRMTLRIGDRCVLSGPLRAAGRVSGGTARLATSGECKLPFGDVFAPMRVDTATLELFGEAVDATLGGVVAGQYVTYRFTGTVVRDAPTETCDALLARPPLKSIEGMTEVTPGHDAWEIWTPEVAGNK